MTTIDERRYVRCPYAQARDYLHESLQPASQSKLPQSVRLTATVPATSIELAKEVRVEYAHATDPMYFDEPWSVRWAPEGGGLYPSFQGQLTVRADESYGSCILELQGEYAPPAGAVGRAFDAALGKKIAQETAQNLLSAIAFQFEARYNNEEAAKHVERTV